MTTKDILAAFGLTADNAIVIGSGILDALGLRPSQDIDITVRPETYTRLAKDKRFSETQTHGRSILTYEELEVGTGWGVLTNAGTEKTFDDLYARSAVIDGVRYITLDFLLAVKQSWLQDDHVRQKDIDDVKLIEQYLHTYARKYIGQTVAVTMDRPLGSKHPKHGYEYSVNYGFVPDTKAPDGGEVDTYVLGVDEPLKEFSGTCIAIIHRTNDYDDKLIVVPEGQDFTNDQICQLTHFQEQWFESDIIRP